MKGMFRTFIVSFVFSVVFVSSAVANIEGAIDEEAIVGAWSGGSCDEGLIFGTNGLSASFDRGGERVNEVVRYSVTGGLLKWHHPNEPMSADIVHASSEYLALAIEGQYGGSKKVRVFQRCSDDGLRREADRMGVKVPASALNKDNVSTAVALGPRVGVWTNQNGACEIPSAGNQIFIIAYGADGDWTWVDYSQDEDMQIATYGSGDIEGYRQVQDAVFSIEFNENSAVREAADSSGEKTTFATFPGYLDGQPVLIDVDVDSLDEPYTYYRCSNVLTWKQILNTRLELDIDLEGDPDAGVFSVWQERIAAWWSSSSETTITTTTTEPVRYSGNEGRFRAACASFGNDEEACSCSWKEAERRFDGANMDLLLANISGETEQARKIMGSGSINGFEYGVVAGRFSRISKERCKAFFY
ncbi:hypothetical protein [Parvibaculum sp.]|jgi:hypothetical protein|uniref:hypothetical protein n=1 Tax=Parvibaculum sp. TaxID=2024848 RepID=UPI002FD92ABC